jgi:nucleoside recognition membrane protein YjiH
MQACLMVVSVDGWTLFLWGYWFWLDLFGVMTLAMRSMGKVADVDALSSFLGHKN